MLAAFSSTAMLIDIAPQSVYLKMKQHIRSLATTSVAVCLLSLLSGCLVVKAVDTAADLAIGTTKVAVKTTGKVVGAAIPDGDDTEDKAH